MVGYPEVIHFVRSSGCPQTRLLRSSRGPLAATLPLFPRRLQLPIPLGENLLLMPAEHVPHVFGPLPQRMNAFSISS
jgi:hypothetical protein